MKEEKYIKLQKLLRDMDSLLVAFSGGVDSTLLVKVAHDTLGERAAAITIDAAFHSRYEIEEAKRIARLIGVRHIMMNAKEMEIEGLALNPPDRCYICKKAVFSCCLDSMREAGFSYLADGSNADDVLDYRPGRRALEELGVRSPLLEAGLVKSEIRELSRELGLDTWNKPALACLMTRFPHGEAVTPEKLAMVERCEDFLRGLGFGLFRVRAHGEIARIELADDEIQRIVEPEMRNLVSQEFHASGFRSVTVDLDGYRCGSMNP